MEQIMEQDNIEMEQRIYQMMTLLQNQMLDSRAQVDRLTAILAQQENRHWLGAQPPEIGPQPAQPEPADVLEAEKRRNDQYQKILRNALRFATAPNQLWWQFELKFGI